MVQPRPVLLSHHSKLFRSCKFVRSKFLTERQIHREKCETLAFCVCAQMLVISCYRPASELHNGASASAAACVAVEWQEWSLCRDIIRVQCFSSYRRHLLSVLSDGFHSPRSSATTTTRSGNLSALSYTILTTPVRF